VSDRSRARSRGSATASRRRHRIGAAPRAGAPANIESAALIKHPSAKRANVAPITTQTIAFVRLLRSIRASAAFA
jgi:hypothetical protein